MSCIVGWPMKSSGAVVNYAERFHGMDQILIDSERCEPTAQVSLKANGIVGNLSRSPYWVDGLKQLSGFVMNANEYVDTTKMVYISHGWESMQIACHLSSPKYIRFASTCNQGGTLSSGAMYNPDEGEIVWVAMGITSQSVSRRLLKLLSAPPFQQSGTGSIRKANDINTRTKSLFSTHNDSCAHPEPTSSSKSSSRRRFTPISSDNNSSRKAFPQQNRKLSGYHRYGSKSPTA